MAMTSTASMSHGGKKAGTLVVIVMKAKNLPNRQKIGKQDPYCIVRLSHIAERTKTDKRGGQAPFWDHETRFPIPINAGPEFTTLKVTVFSDDTRDPTPIGDASIDLKPVLKDGEFDEWVELSYKNRYAGEVYLEMTYYSELPPPVPPLPKEVQSRGLHSRDSSPSGGTPRMKRRPLPQQPDLGDAGPPPSRGYPRHSYDQLPPSTSHSNRPSSQSREHSPHINHRPPHRSSYDPQTSGDHPHYFEYDLPQQSYEYPVYHPPDSPTLGRHRSDTSLRDQLYDVPPPEDVVDPSPYPPLNIVREDPRIRPRTSLSGPRPSYDRSRPTYSPHTDDRYRQAAPRMSLDNYNAHEVTLPESSNEMQGEPEEGIPVQPYVSPRRQSRSSPAPVQRYSPQINHNTPPHPSPHTPRHQRSYSPHTPQQYGQSSPIQRPSDQHYSPTPPPHRYTGTPPPPSRSSPSPRTPLSGTSPHLPPKRPSPVPAIDNLPPSSYAPERIPPSQRRALPTPPVASELPPENSTSASPLPYRAPEIPAKIPLGMTDKEYWAMKELEGDVGDVRLHGLNEDRGWREVRNALPDVEVRRWNTE